MRTVAVVCLLTISLPALLHAQENHPGSWFYSEAIHNAFLRYEKTHEARYWEIAFKTAEKKKNAFLFENIRKPGNKQTRYQTLKGQTPTVVELQSMLRNKETAVISYSSGPDELYIFLITSGTFYAGHFPLDSIFFNHINTFKSSLHAGKDFDKEIARKLYQKLIGPVKPYLQGKTHLVIVPDEETGLLPFEALVPDKGPDRFLLHDYAISYSYNVTALANTFSRPAAVDRQEVLAIAPFNIPSSEKDIMNIRADHVLGTDASKTQFMKIAPEYSIIHLSTSANTLNPDHSFIDFHSAGTGSDTISRLFRSEIYQLSLKNVHLVILNSCQSFEKKPESSMGIVSMAQAFASAGCSNFITTRWETDGEAAGKISMKLHQYIQKGYGYAQALQKARLDYLRNPVIEEQLKSPRYWAGFILIGEIDTVPPNHKFFYYLAFAFTIIVVVYILRRKNSKRRHAEYPEYP